jgi:hypothetical protein
MIRCASVCRRFAIRFLLVSVIVIGLAWPVSAQLVVFDPANLANALLRYAELQQTYTQLVTTYQQIRTQYLLLLQQAQRLPFDMSARYRAVANPWLPFTAANAYGLTTGWIAAANTGQAASAGYTRATQVLLPYGGAITQLSAEEAARVRARYDRLQLADASVVHGLEALGFLRGRQPSIETAIQNLETDAYSTNTDLHTQIAVLNKINATAVASARLAKDANNLLVSLLEQQLLETTERREGAVQGINAHIVFTMQARPLLAQTTAQTTAALTTFRIP